MGKIIRMRGKISKLSGILKVRIQTGMVIPILWKSVPYSFQEILKIILA
jgi:hypothetical protein